MSLPNYMPWKHCPPLVAFKRYYGIALLIFCWAWSFGLLAQDMDSTILVKGRYITGLNGSISSQILGGTVFGGQETRKVNEYTIGTTSGYFIADGWTMGVDFELGKTELRNQELHVASERLSLGVWSRYYFVRYFNGALFADLIPFYAVTNERNEIYTPNFILEEDVEGVGLGLKPAIGFTYLMNKNVGFGMSVSYEFGRIYAERTNRLLNVVTQENYDFNKLSFNFSFQVYLDQFFF